MDDKGCLYVPIHHPLGFKQQPLEDAGIHIFHLISHNSHIKKDRATLEHQTKFIEFCSPCFLFLVCNCSS